MLELKGIRYDGVEFVTIKAFVDEVYNEKDVYNLVGERTLQRYAKSDKISSIKLGRDILISYPEAHEMFKKQ